MHLLVVVYLHVCRDWVLHIVLEFLTVELGHFFTDDFGTNLFVLLPFLNKAPHCFSLHVLGWVLGSW